MELVKLKPLLENLAQEDMVQNHPPSNVFGAYGTMENYLYSLLQDPKIIWVSDVKNIMEEANTHRDVFLNKCWSLGKIPSPKNKVLMSCDNKVLGIDNLPTESYPDSIIFSYFKINELNEGKIATPIFYRINFNLGNFPFKICGYEIPGATKIRGEIGTKIMKTHVGNCIGESADNLFSMLTYFNHCSKSHTREYVR